MRSPSTPVPGRGLKGRYFRSVWRSDQVREGREEPGRPGPNATRCAKRPGARRQGGAGASARRSPSTSWLAGGGIKGGVRYGESDEWSYKAVKNVTYCYDLHATVLHLLGIDHEKLTFRHNGIDRRLTDVHGHVIKEILA